MDFRHVLLPILVAFLFCQNLDADELPAAQCKTLRTVRVDTPPVIDGVLDDDAWKGAPVITDLHQVIPVEYAPPSQPSEFFVVYDDDALYIGAYLYDDPNKIIGRILRQGDRIMGDDRISLVLEPFDNDRSGYFFMLSVNNVRFEGIYEGARDINFDWDCIWKTETARTHDGWIAEVAIPFKSLSFPPDRDTWGFTVGRDIVRNQERINWHSRERWITLDCIGYLTGLEGMDQGKGLDIVPSISFQRAHDYDLSDTEYDIEPSVDIFYQVTPNLSASLTVNTDFSATEVDTRQINLTRFSLFFPEKRDFFLKDADIFDFGRIGTERGLQIPRVEMESGRPYYSRTIGLSDTGEPVDLEFGGKVSGRAGEWDFGTQMIRQEDFINGHGKLVETTDIIVARTVRNILAESTIGAIVTHGDPASNEGNTLIGADFLYRNTRIEGQTIEAEAWYQKTDSDGLEGDDAAWSLSARLRNESKLRARLMYKEFGKNYNPALGFVSRPGVSNYIGLMGYMFRPKHDLVRDFYVGMDYIRIEDTEGHLQTSAFGFNPLDIETHVGDKFRLRYERNREGLTEVFEIFPGVEIPAGSYGWDTYSLWVEGARQRMLSGWASISKGTDYNGDRWELLGGLTWRPSKHFAAEASYTYNDFDLPYGSFITRLMSLETDIVFLDTLSWTTLVQYDNRSKDLGIHSRLHFIPEAGRDLYLVINHNFVDEDDGLSSTRSDIVLKINYTFRF